MAGINKAILIGNLGKDPEIRSLQNGGRVASFRPATSETWKDKATGERKERTEWHRVVVFNENLVGVVERFVKKGSKLYVEGQIETRKYTDNQGQDRYTTEIVLRQFRGEITLLDSAGSGAPPPNDNADPRGGRPDPDASRGGYGGGGPTRGPVEDLDDEIPF